LESATYTADCAPPPSTPPTPPATPVVQPAAAPRAAVDADCNGFDVTLTNTDGTADATFTVTGPGGKDREVTVPAGEKTSLTFPVTEDEERTVSVSVGGDEIASRSYTADCIKGEEVFRPPTVQGGPTPPAAVSPAAAALPDTGAPAQQWMLLVGLMMVTVGGTLLVSRRRLTS
ncbi:MAG: phospholipase domain-containing protein, partial [Nocardioides sp.]